MFSSKMNINKINRCHKRALRTVYDKFELDFNSLLAINSDITIHTRHLQFLMVEVYKALKALSPEFMHNLFETKETKYALRRKNLLTLPEANSVKYGLTLFILGRTLKARHRFKPLSFFSCLIIFVKTF